MHKNNTFWEQKIKFEVSTSNDDDSTNDCIYVWGNFAFMNSYFNYLRILMYLHSAFIVFIIVYS